MVSAPTDYRTLSSTHEYSRVLTVVSAPTDYGTLSSTHEYSRVLTVVSAPTDYGTLWREETSALWPEYSRTREYSRVLASARHSLCHGMQRTVVSLQCC